MTQENIKTERQLFMESEDGPRGRRDGQHSQPIHPQRRSSRQGQGEGRPAVAADMAGHGKTAFSPVLYTHTLLEAAGAIPPSGWYEFDLCFLEKAKEMVILELPAGRIARAS